MRSQQEAEYILYHIFHMFIESTGNSDQSKTLEQIRTLVVSYLFEVEREKRSRERAAVSSRADVEPPHSTARLEQREPQPPHTQNSLFPFQ